MNASLLIEACVDSPQSALAAEQGGAGRVELCADLFAGGCTPSAGSILLARRLLSIPVNVIIRPRGGDFCYSEAEYDPDAGGGGGCRADGKPDRARAAA